MKTKTYKTEKVLSSNRIFAASLKGMAIIHVLLFIFGNSVMAQCAYPVDIILQNKIFCGCEFNSYKAKNSITLYNVSTLKNSNLILQAPMIILFNTVNLSGNVTLKAIDPCTLTSGEFFPDNLISSCKQVCSPLQTIEHTSFTLSVNGSFGTAPIWKWYKNQLGDDSPPDPTSIGQGASITLTQTQQTDYFVRDESITPYGEFAKIKILIMDCTIDILPCSGCSGL